jgi:hypothetical protein
MRIALCILSLTAVTSFAAQVVVTDVTYTHSGQTTSDSHYVLAPRSGTPANWASPVDYSHGTAVVRLEVFTKPTATPTRFQICFEGNPSYACTNQAPAYTTTGVYTWTTPFTSFYQYSSVNWALGVRDIALILKDTSNGKPSPENVGATESAKYMPTNLRVTVTLVSPGSTYIPPSDTVDAGVDAGLDAGIDAGIDAGQVTTPDAGVRDAGVVVADAGTPEAEPDAGTSPEPADAGAPVIADAGATPEPQPAIGTEAWEATGTGCTSAPAGVLFVLSLVFAARRRTRNQR